MMERERIDRVVALPGKWACLTLDFESDYGDRLNAFNILQRERPGIERLVSLATAGKTPISAFIRTDLLTRFPETVELLPRLAADLHCHSHTHATNAWHGAEEIPRTYEAFCRAFGRPPVGYRAPQGVLHAGDVALLKQAGFRFSSSVFPSFRPGKFNNLHRPLIPFVYDNGLVELPMAALPGIRLILSLSYLKLLGWRLHRFLQRLTGISNVIVFDAHLHDFIHCEESFRRLPAGLRLAYGRNAHRGFDYFERFIALLRSLGYRFVTMTELFELTVAAARSGDGAA